MVTEAEVRAVLDHVFHPSFGMSLTALEMVHAVRVSSSSIEVDLVMNCPGAEGALALARRMLHALIGEGAVRLMVLPLVWRPPWE
jgi:metal-sulfur cluster biosynthetic enzyme